MTKVSSPTSATFETRLSAARERYPFLAPPQEPEELGRLERFRVLEVLGEGGMGIVFLAQDNLNRRVALKVIRPELASTGDAGKRFLREAQLAASLKHDHVVT